MIFFEIKTSNPDIEFSENNNTKICGPVQIMDKTPPVTSFSADGLVFFDGTQYYARKNVQYRLEAQDMYGSVQTIEYQIDNYSFRPYTSAFTLNTDGDHAISFRARDNSGNWEILKTILVKVEIPPDTPEGLEGQYINSKIQLTWLPNDESDISHYFVYQNQEKIPVSDYSYDVYEASIGLDIPINAIYTYQVSAVNKTGLESNLSAPIRVSAYSESFVILLPHTETYVIDPQLTISGLIKENVRLGFCVNGQLQYSLVTMPEGTFEVSDILLAEGENVITCAVLDSNDLLSEASDPIIIHYIKRPHTPENIEAVPGDTTISLLWNDSNETDIIGYYIYRNNEKLLYQFAPITQPSFTDTRLSNHMSYTYAVTCVDSKYIEGLPTNPVVATPIAGDWKIQGKRKKRTSRQMETFSLFAPSQHNVITIDIINNRSPMRSRTFTVTAAMDQVITITDGISKKKRIKAGQQQAFAFTFDIVCLAEDKNHLLTFTIADDSGYESTITKLLAITTTLNKCQSCSNDQVVGIHCPEKECMISMGCHPSSGCTYIQEEKTQCNIDIGDSGHIHFVGDNLCQTVPSHFFSPVTSTGRQDKLSIEIPMNEASKISVGIYQPDSEWVKSIIHQQIFTSEKISVEWDGKAADGTLMDDGLYHLIITRANNITRQYIHVDNVYPKADISHIFQPSDTCIEIHGTATDSNIYTATIECLSCTETEFDIYMKPLPVSDDLIAILNTNEMKTSGYTICLKVADKAGNERHVIRHFNAHPSTGVYTYDNTIVSGYQSVPDYPDIWVDDFIPEGSLTIDTWEWESDISFSGDQAHTHPKQDGVHGHYFIRPNNPLHLSETDNIIQYVYLSPEHPPLEILLQFYTDEGNGEHRVYWGENLIQTTGTKGSASLKYMGELPEKGKWTRLIIPAADLDLSEKDVRGIAYVSYNGQVWWDRTTKSSRYDDPDMGYQQRPHISSNYHSSSTIYYAVLLQTMEECLLINFSLFLKIVLPVS